MRFDGWNVWNFLSIAVLRGLNITVMLKKFQNFREYGPGLELDARILEFLEFFEHYRVS